MGLDRPGREQDDVLRTRRRRRGRGRPDLEHRRSLLDGSTGNIAYVGDKTSATTAITNGFDAGGRILKAFDSADRRFSYTYTSIDSTSRLTQVKAEIKASGTWASPTGVEEVGKVDYAYYTTAENRSWGESGDLKLVTLTVRLNDETTPVTQTKKKHYRYYEGAFDAGDVDHRGRAHQIRMVVDFEGTRRYDLLDSTFDETFLTGTFAQPQALRIRLPGVRQRSKGRQGLDGGRLRLRRRQRGRCVRVHVRGERDLLACIRLSNDVGDPGCRREARRQLPDAVLRRGRPAAGPGDQRCRPRQAARRTCG